ncbi:MAG: hypothetical protein D6761_00630 [Candidatus Dadabacteria bacterium]|nr:MAG: hypothetical protein D6761_00630 [Candidatus Dadabacteria bacterium]
MTVLLDTHNLIWWFQGSERLSSARQEALDAIAPDAPGVSDITPWEVARLVQKGRIGLRIPLRDWLEAATAPPLVRRVPITPANCRHRCGTIAAISQGPGGPHPGCHGACDGRAPCDGRSTNSRKRDGAGGLTSVRGGFSCPV